MANPKETATLPSQEKITVEQIFPTALAAFLSRQTGKDFPQDNYQDIFTSLRETALPQQERLLVSFFTEEVEGFPHGEELGKELAKINNISWFQPNQEPEQDVLEQLTRTYLERLNYPPKSLIPLRIIRKNWDAAGDAVWNTVVWDATRDAAQGAASEAAQGAASEAAQGAAWGKVREAVWYAARKADQDVSDSDPAWYMGQDAAWYAVQETARNTAKNAALGAASEAARYAEWIVVKDLMPTRGYSKGNPFEPLMEIYKLGCWPIGLVINKETRITEFMVFVPPVANSKTV